MSGRSNLFRAPPRGRPKKREQVSPKLLNYQQQMEQFLRGTSGPASPCRRIDPRTGEVIEILERKQ